MGKDRPSRFGELLRRFRIAAGLTQEELAEHAGLSARGVSDLERGTRSRPHPDTLRRLAEALSLSAADRAVLGAARRHSHRVTDQSGGTQPLAGLGTNLPVDLAPSSTAQNLVEASPFVGRAPELDRLTALLD
jgi:transcriptional regulator with XRE-family HTH domain